jgi:hypothetical protein
MVIFVEISLFRWKSSNALLEPLQRPSGQSGGRQRDGKLYSGKRNGPMQPGGPFLPQGMNRPLASSSLGGEIYLLFDVLRPLRYSVRLNSGVAMSSVLMPKTNRKSRSYWMATKPPSFSSTALKPCTQ